MPSAPALTARSRGQTPQPSSSVDALEPSQSAGRSGDVSGDADRNLGRKILLLALLSGALLRLGPAMRIGGIYWPDETMKSLEQAHRVVFGYGFVPWEFVNGVSHWTWPGVLAGLLKLAALVGLDEPSEYLRVVQGALALCGVATIYGCHRLARVHGASTLTASAGAVLFALAAPAVYFAHRALTETASTLPVVLGLAMTLAPRASRRQVVVGSSLLALSVLLRLQNGLFPMIVLGVLAIRRQRRATLEAGAVLAVGAFLFGLIDLLTWDSWFDSALEYVRFNLIEGRASEFGKADFFFYGRVLVSSVGLPGAVVLLVLPLLALRRAPGLVLGAAAYLLVHSVVPHKEGRFLLPLLPVLCALAAIGLHELGRLAGQRAVRLGAGLVVASAVVSLSGLPQLTIGDLGQLGGGASAHGRNDSVNRLLLVAHDREDLCGLRIEDAHVVFTGGYAYLHRPVPIYNDDAGVRGEGVFNYLIAWKDGGHLPPGELVARDGIFVLVRLPSAGCFAETPTGPIGGPIPNERFGREAP